MQKQPRELTYWCSASWGDDKPTSRIRHFSLRTDRTVSGPVMTTNEQIT